MVVHSRLLSPRAGEVAIPMLLRVRTGNGRGFLLKLSQAAKTCPPFLVILGGGLQSDACDSGFCVAMPSFNAHSGARCCPFLWFGEIAIPCFAASCKSARTASLSQSPLAGETKEAFPVVSCASITK